MDLASSIVGVWRYTSFIDREVESGRFSSRLEIIRAGYIVYAIARHIVFSLVGDRNVPASANPTDAERIALFRSSGSGGGMYEVEEDNCVTITWHASWNQWWTGRTQKRQVQIEGDKMTITSAPTKSVATGKEIIFIITLERVE